LEEGLTWAFGDGYVKSVGRKVYTELGGGDPRSLVS